jgi:hypothetical protein
LARSHDISSGSFSDGFLIVEIRGSDPDRGSGAEAYFLAGRPDTGLLVGYWTGWDPEIRKIVTCPYVLSRQRDAAKIAAENKDWLERDCYTK